MRARVSALLFGLVLIAASQPLHAKCPFKRFHIIVSAVDGETNLGISGANLTLFANDETEAWLPENASSHVIVTDPRGAFSDTFDFGTGSSSFFGMDRCKRKLKKLQVVATREGYRPARISISVAKEVTSSTPVDVTVRVPAIMLLPLK